MPNELSVLHKNFSEQKENSDFFNSYFCSDKKQTKVSFVGPSRFLHLIKNISLKNCAKIDALQKQVQPGYVRDAENSETVLIITDQNK